MLTFENKNNVDFEDTHIFKKIFNNKSIIDILSHYSQNNIRNKVNSFIILKTMFGNTIIIPETESGMVIFKESRDRLTPYQAGLLLTMHISTTYVIEMAAFFRDTSCNNVMSLFEDYRIELGRLAEEAEFVQVMMKFKVEMNEEENAIN